MADTRQLGTTPSWAVASVSAIFIILGLILVFVIAQVDKLLKRAHKTRLVHTLDRIKEELMLLGFISLLLTVSEDKIVKVCVKSSIMDGWNPCRRKYAAESPATQGLGGRRRSLLFALNSWLTNDLDQPLLQHGRILQDEGVCKEGDESILSAVVLHELHVYIFVLACAHVLNALLVMFLATLKLRLWRPWEESAQRTEPSELKEISKSLTWDRHLSFVYRHTGNPVKRNVYLVWVVCFFRQFGRSVARSDYLSLRQGFIATHKLRPQFNFHSYVLRSLEDEFPNVVEITPILWLLLVVILALNTSSTTLYFWVALIPPLLILALGTKLQHVIATLALENAGIGPRGSNSLESPFTPRDDLFWFHKPGIILYLIKYVTFQNSYETTIYLAYVWTNGFHSCYFENEALLFIRIGLGWVTTIMCSFVTLPLYAIVTQMGTHYKRAIFQETTQQTLRTWGERARKRVKQKIPFHRSQDNADCPRNNEVSDDDSARDEHHELSFRHGGRRSRIESPQISEPLLDDGGSGAQRRIYRCRSEPIPNLNRLLLSSELFPEAPRNSAFEVSKVTIKVDERDC